MPRITAEALQAFLETCEDDPEGYILACMEYSDPVAGLFDTDRSVTLYSFGTIHTDLDLDQTRELEGGIYVLEFPSTGFGPLHSWPASQASCSATIRRLL